MEWVDITNRISIMPETTKTNLQTWEWETELQLFYTM